MVSDIGPSRSSSIKVPVIPFALKLEWNGREREVIQVTLLGKL